MTSMDQTPAKRRRWFRFSLRLLFVVMTVLCIWLGIQVNAARRQKEAVAAILRAGGEVNYDYQMMPDPIVPAMGGFSISFFSMFYADRNVSPPGPTWLRNQFGDEYFRTAVQGYIHLYDPVAARAAISGLANLHAVKCVQLFGPDREIEDSDLNPLGQLDHLERLWLWRTHVTGVFLAQIRHPGSMTQLSLEENDIDDAAMAHIGNMTSLENLDLEENARITDAGLVHLRKLTNLKVLALNATGITDAGLKHLIGLNCLSYLDLSNTQASRNGIRELQKSLPNCQIRSP